MTLHLVFNLTLTWNFYPNFIKVVQTVYYNTRYSLATRNMSDIDLWKIWPLISSRSLSLEFGHDLVNL